MLEDRVGRADVRVVYAVPLTVLVECEESRRGCPAVRDYESVLRLDFVAEQRELTGDEVYRSDQPRGTIVAAFGLPPDEFERYRATLDVSLRQLSAQAFGEPFAGWAPMDPPFDTGLPAVVGRPTWVCFDTGDSAVVLRVERRVDVGPNGEELDTGQSSHTYAEFPTALCDEMLSATADGYPQSIETPPAPQRLLETVVLHTETVLLDRHEVDTLLRPPDGIRTIKQQAPDGITAGGASGGGSDELSYAVQMSGGWFYSGWALPVDLPVEALDLNAWLHRFTVDTVERSFGSRPSDRPLERDEFHIAYLATVPPATNVEEWDGTIHSVPPAELPVVRDAVAEQPARIDRAAYLEAAIERLDVHHGPPLDLLEEWSAVPEAGLVSEGWISVVCRSDGTAIYHLPPTQAANRVLNADLFCAAVEARIER